MTSIKNIFDKFKSDNFSELIHNSLKFANSFQQFESSIQKEFDEGFFRKKSSKTSYLTEKDFMDIWNEKIITSIDFINSPELHNNRSFSQLINNAIACGFSKCKQELEDKLKEREMIIEKDGDELRKLLLDYGKLKQELKEKDKLIEKMFSKEQVEGMTKGKDKELQLCHQTNKKFIEKSDKLIDKLEQKDKEWTEKINKIYENIDKIFDYVEIKRKKDKKVAPDDLEYWIERTKELIKQELKSLLESENKSRVVPLGKKCIASTKSENSRRTKYKRRVDKK